MTITGTTVLTRTLKDPSQNYVYDGSLEFACDDGVTYRPRRFITDEATIPRIFWWIPGFGPDDWVEAAILHDWMYVEHDVNAMFTVTRRQVDDYMYEAILACGYSRIVAYFAWLGVRIGGKFYW